MDLFMERLAKDPSIHIYHYAVRADRAGPAQAAWDPRRRGRSLAAWRRLVDLYRSCAGRARVGRATRSSGSALYRYTRRSACRRRSRHRRLRGLAAGGRGRARRRGPPKIERYNRDVVSTMLLRTGSRAAAGAGHEVGAPRPCQSGEATEDLRDPRACKRSRIA
jgi:hypothetical protein